MSDTQMAALYAALAAAQAKFQPITKNREVMITMKSGGRYKFRYADLDEINLRTRPALTENGLAVMQIVSSEPNGATFIETRLTHKDGGAVSARLDIKGPREYPDPKEFGAVVTYLRRYQITPLLGVAADDDLDQDGKGLEGRGDKGGDQDQGPRRGRRSQYAGGQPHCQRAQDRHRRSGGGVLEGEQRQAGQVAPTRTPSSRMPWSSTARRCRPSRLKG